MDYFVRPNSIVRRIWGSSDTILFIFAGAAAEFALNKAVDWLYFTGKLPSDPLGRLFSTVRYARKIVFAPRTEAEQAIRSMAKIHQAVENARGASIPDWAYRDVLFMLIHYSIAAHELLEGKLTFDEKEEVFDVFYRVGAGMGLQGLPKTYFEWRSAREEHLNGDLAMSGYTSDLFRQYQKHLGIVRYRILWESQKLVVPRQVKTLLGMSEKSLLSPTLPVYRISKTLKAETIVKGILLPRKYYRQIKELDLHKS